MAAKPRTSSPNTVQFIANLGGLSSPATSKGTVELERARCCTQFKNSSSPSEKSNSLIGR
jgi:hypothetical protein